MRSHNSFETWSNFELVFEEKDFDVFSFPSQPLPLDFNACSRHAALDFEFDLPIQETTYDAFPLKEDILMYDPFYSLMDFEQSQNMVQGYHEFNMEVLVEKKMIRRQRMEKGNRTKKLSRATISKYFYMPIKRVAKELNVGLTLLKKRCRELGIRRWSHRKLEMRNKEEGGHKAEKKLIEAIEILESQKKLMEEILDTQLEDQTQRLRQACFKDYKKKKFMGMMKSQYSFHSNFTTNSPTASLDSGPKEKEEEPEQDAEEDDLKSIIANFLSSSNANIEKDQLQAFILNLLALLKKSYYKYSS